MGAFMKSVNILLLLSTLCISILPSLSFADVNAFFRRPWDYIATVELQQYHEGLKKLSKLDIDIAGVDYSNKLVDVLISSEQLTQLERLGLKVMIQQAKGVTRGPDEEYKNAQEIEDILKDFNSSYPSITKLMSIGKSLEGRDIWAIKISDNAKVDEFLTEPAILFNSMHHAREVMTPEVSIDIAEYLLSNYNTSQQVADWVNSNEIWIIPMFNVDGNNKMWNYDSWWRKNTRGGYGVDLNRNYPTGWNSCNGSSGSQSSQTYRGPSPASEPETQAMMNFIKKIRPVFNISYHSYSELVIYPYGCEDKRTQTKDVVEPIGKQIANLIDYEPGTAWELLYNADGGDIDWMYDAYQVIPFVIELNSRWVGFHPNYSRWRNKTVKRNRPGWQYLLNRIEESGVRGLVKFEDIPYSDYVVEVYKLNKDKKTFYQTYQGHSTGIYHLILKPGHYQLSFKSRIDSKVLRQESVVVGNNRQILDINL
jgi:carboxypeptidase T